MNDIYIKNPSTENTINYQGQNILPGEYFLIPEDKILIWQTDSALISAIASNPAIAIVAKLDDGNNDITDVNNAVNYLKQINDLEIDDEGRQINRNAYGKKGWTYLAHPIEFTTSEKDSVFSEDFKGDDRADYALRFYDDAGVELTDQTAIDAYCVETRLTIRPAYDYEVISGTVDIHSAITENIRMWVVGGVMDQYDMPWQYPAAGIYQVKEFAGGINFKYIGADQKMETDGRAAKFMAKNKTGVPFQTNQFQFIMKHLVGCKKDFMVVLEYFRA